MNKKLFRTHWLATVLAAFLAIQAPLALAAMVSTEDMTTQNQLDAERAKVRAFLERAGVMERMRAMGVDGLAAGGLLGTTDLILILLIVILIAVIV